MKKIFSIVLATAMICGMILPMAVSAEDPASVALSATAETKIELESYASSFAVSGGALESGADTVVGQAGYASVLNKSGASNGQVLYFETGKYTNLYSVVTQGAIPVSVTEAGTYIITVTATSAGSGSKLKVVVDGVTYDRKSATDLGNIYANADYPGQDVIFEVPLTTNTNAITVQFGASSGKFLMMLDCMKVKLKTAEIKADGVTTIEAEGYANTFAVSGGELESGQSLGTFAKIMDKPNTSGSKCLYFETGKYTNLYSVVTQGAIPVSVTAPGNYTVTVTATSAGSGGKVKLVVDGVTYDRISTADRGNIYDNTGYPGQDIIFNVPLTANTKKITVQFGGSSGKFLLMLDCIKLELKKTAIAADGVTNFEFEKYAKFFTVSGGALDAGQAQGTFADVKTGRADASGDACVFFDTGKYNNTNTMLNVSFPVSVTEAGNYIVAVTSTNVGSGPNARVIVDGTTYSTPTASKSLGNIYSNASYPGQDYFFEVPLTAATNEITVQFRASSQRFSMFIDCVKVKKAAVTGISKTTGEATVKYAAAEGPSEAGTATLALYNDGVLVSVEKWAVTPEVVLNEIVLSYTTAFTGDYDEAKVFVWKDFDVTCAPLAVAKDLTIND